MPPRPGFEVTRGDSNPDSAHRLHAKLGSKRASQRTDRRITNVNECLVGESGGDSLLLKATERLLTLPSHPIPNHFPEATTAHPAQNNRRTRSEQPGKIDGQLSEVLDAIQCSKV